MRWYVAYPLSYRQIEETMEERGVEVDHSTLIRWVLKNVPVSDKAFLARKRPGVQRLLVSGGTLAKAAERCPSAIHPRDEA
jgi:transposase-like protein